MILTILHALGAVESLGALVVCAVDVHAHIQNLFCAAAWALNCPGSLKPFGLLGNVCLLHRVNLLVELEHEEFRQELRGCFVWRGVVFMIHLYLLYIYISCYC